MKKGFKYLGFVALAIAIIVTVQSVKIGFMFFDFKKMIKTLDTPKTSGLVKKPDPPSIMVDLTPPKDMKIDSSKISSFPVNNFGKTLVKDEIILQQLSGLDEQHFANFRREMISRVVKLAKNLPKASALPEVLDFGAPVMKFRDIRETARYWYFHGRYYAAKKDFNASIACFAGIILLAHQLENSPTETSASLISRMIAIAIRSYGCTGLIETNAKYLFSVQRMKDWVGIFHKLEQEVQSMARPFSAEKLVIPSAFAPQNMKHNSMMVREMRDKDLQQKYIGGYFDPIINACGLPFSEAVKVSQQKNDELIAMQKNLLSVSSIKYFFWPEEFMMQFLLMLSLPNFKQALMLDFRSRNLLRGAVVALALQAYKNEKRFLPDNLEALQQWLNRELPQDIYSNSPFSYEPKSDKILYSVGEDGQAHTGDDQIFMPF